MEISSNSAVLRSIPGCHPAGKTTASTISSVSDFCFPEGKTFCRELKFSAREVRKGKFYGYADKGHLEYYYGKRLTVCGERKEREGNGGKGVSLKKRMKLVKGLVKDLSAFSELGFGLDSDTGLGDDDKGKMISEAAEILLAQLKQLRAEEKESKKNQEKMANMKTMQKEKMPDCESSSSESSDSECDEVVNMKQPGMQAFVQSVENKMQLPCQDPAPVAPIIEASITESFGSEVQSLQNLEQRCGSGSATNSSDKIHEPVIEVSSSQTLVQNLSSAVASSSSSCCSSTSSSSVNAIGCDTNAMSVGKVEVCMGGKCKKSGAPALIEEFQRVLGFESTVVGCKCMGKCKSGPNVRVTDSSDTMQAASNPLYIGVGLEDVGLIVANYLGEEVKGLGLAAAS
ncbi:hypothetical protein Ancab_010474 [Ancistrocladus abbreviatus]